MGIRLDEVNRRIIHALMDDARNTSAPMIADEVGVSPATVRNRIEQLEEANVLQGYHANVNFEAANRHFRNLYICHAPVDSRERLANQARLIPGVINVRVLMAGRRNLHILAVGEDTSDLRRVAREIAALGIEIEDEDLVQSEDYQSYQPFGPDNEAPYALSDFISLTGNAEVAEVTIEDDAPIAGMTLAEAGDDDVLDDQLLVVSIERDDKVVTPRGQTRIRADDLLTIVSRNGIAEPSLDAFRAES
ncbi:Lrp/AsnC family transcriptional regulator [Natrinema salifodinae]|uniref:DNA-binding transcriptional regulator, Lrp family n=1 Tax=Natrinema salifodinae TaxID=1202768 RepID=A0A1I0Q8Z8_9EURY|nr:AsnC family transcriptional regulator [Natrinema salifodinae]SEW23480.1 DNA-binding transcriptional regulator, Lrp family [Natrinema salifodinae]